MSSELQFQLKELAIAILQSNTLSPKDIKSKALQIYNQAIIMEHEVLQADTRVLEDKSEINSVGYGTEKEAEKETEITSVATEIASTAKETAQQTTKETTKETTSEIIDETLIAAEEEIQSTEQTVTNEIEKELLPNSESNTPEIVEEEKIVAEASPKNETLENEIATTDEDSPIVEAPTLLQELEDLTADFNLPDFEPLQSEELPLANQEENPVESQQEEPLDTLEINAEESIEKIDKEVSVQVVSEVKKEKTATSSTPAAVEKPLSLNDKLHSGFKIGLNDRLAFTQHLFAGNQEDFTRVISQLNTTPSLEEAVSFINGVIKPEYNYWEGKEPYEIRFLELIERNFQS